MFELKCQAACSLWEPWILFWADYFCLQDGRPHSLMSVPSDPPVLEGGCQFSDNRSSHDCGDKNQGQGKPLFLSFSILGALYKSTSKYSLQLKYGDSSCGFGTFVLQQVARIR